MKYWILEIKTKEGLRIYSYSYNSDKKKIVKPNGKIKYKEL